jgi:hypothetical protein
LLLVILSSLTFHVPAHAVGELARAVGPLVNVSVLLIVVLHAVVAVRTSTVMEGVVTLFIVVPHIVVRVDAMVVSVPGTAVRRVVPAM